MKGRQGTRTKYTPEIEGKLQEILELERRKDALLGRGHKQKMTNVQIHAELLEAGFDISRATINAELAKLRRKLPKVFIRQEYDFGDRLEYDFGQVKIDCGYGYKT